MDSAPPDGDAPGSTAGVHRLPTRLFHPDPGLRATKRSVRAAVLVPTVFALADYGTSNTQTPLFAVFGSVALLLFTDFGGPLRVRSRSYLGLWLAGAVFIAVGTLCSTDAAAAVVGMAAAAFAVLFAGVVSPQAVAGSTAALLTFVLPVSEQAGASAIGDRLLGWALAGALCIPVALFVWAGRWHDPLRRALADAAGAVAVLVAGTAAAGPVAADRTEVERALRALRERYEATPYRPTGAGPTDVALTNLVPRLEWVGSCAMEATARPPPAAERDRVVEVEAAASAVLCAVSDLLEPGRPVGHRGAADVLRGSVGRLTAARDAATDAVLASLAEVAAPGTGTVDAGTDAASALIRVDPTFSARMLAFALEMLAAVVLDALGPAVGSVTPAARFRATLRSYARVAAGHLTLRSVWFRNSVRGAVGLALAVLVVEVTTVQHGFWVVLGTLSVLRSNALGTGATAVRAVLGTAIGFLVGYVALVALGPHDAELWLLLPIAVLVAGIAPTLISFTAGQAGFTVLVVLVFNIIDPVGAGIGLIRIEDVLIGAAVSVVVGLLFWPRGAGAELSRALGRSYATAAAWLATSVDQVGRAGAGRDVGSPDAGDVGTETTGASDRIRWSPERVAALGAARRLDDAYRQYLGERGAKSVPLSVVTSLLTGSARIRLTAVTLDGLPDLARPGDPAPPPQVLVARDAVTAECAAVEAWFDRFTASLGSRAQVVPAAAPVDDRLAPELVDAWSAARREGRREGLIAVLRLLWVEERTADLRRLQAELAGTVTAP